MLDGAVDFSAGPCLVGEVGGYVVESTDCLLCRESDVLRRFAGGEA